MTCEYWKRAVGGLGVPNGELSVHSTGDLPIDEEEQLVYVTAKAPGDVFR